MNRAILAFVLLASSACAHNKIPNTDVEDTPASRDVVTFVESYRKAVVARDVNKLLRFAAQDYYDDMGTPEGTDDVDRERLAERLKETFGPDLLAVHYDIRYRDVTFLPSKKQVLVDFTYIGRFRLNTSEGSRWERRLADHRIVLAQTKGGFEILSGM